MASPEENPLASDPDPNAAFVEIRYSLPALLREVKRDRSSTALAMEKLDQAAITILFEQHRSHRESQGRRR